MSTFGLMSALRGAGRQRIPATASTYYGAMQATGSHVFKIEQYTQVREKLATGTAILSSPFGVGGHHWRIACYPNGDAQRDQGYISLYLRHAGHAWAGGATAGYRMSILDKSSEPARTRYMDVHRFAGDGWGFKDFMKLEDLDKERHRLVDEDDDSLSVLCDITVDLDDGPRAHRSSSYAHARAVPPAPVTAEEFVKAAAPPFQLHGIAEAIWSREAADVRIQLGDGQTLAAHRWVLEARSPVFKADLALAASSDDTVAELRVHDMDADVCRAMLQFIYTDALPPRELGSAVAERLLVAADRYEVEKLRLVCEEALCKSIDASSVVAALTLAERHGCPALWEACMQFLSSPGNMSRVMASSDAFEKLKTGCPSALLEILDRKRPLHEQLISEAS